jgi:competence ComEA-like helix-hairpin-helix protein
MLAHVLALYLAVAPKTSLPPGKGKAIVAKTCVNCHALKVVTSKRATREQWAALVDQMVSRGADLTDDEIDIVVSYLAKNFPLKAGASAPAKNNFLSADDSAGDSVNINHAGVAEIAAVLHLSTEECNAIVAYRDKNGRFKTWRDVAKVPGVAASEIGNRKHQLRF